MALFHFHRRRRLRRSIAHWRRCITSASLFVERSAEMIMPAWLRPMMRLPSGWWHVLRCAAPRQARCGSRHSFYQRRKRRWFLPRTCLQRCSCAPSSACRFPSWFVVWSCCVFAWQPRRWDRARTLRVAAAPQLRRNRGRRSTADHAVYRRGTGPNERGLRTCSRRSWVLRRVGRSDAPETMSECRVPADLFTPRHCHEVGHRTPASTLVFVRSSCLWSASMRGGR
jgi:hypothetical protein